MRTFAIVFGLIVPFAALFSAQKAGIDFPDTITVSGKTLALNGIGIREATIFKVDVYVAALYVPKKSKASQTLLEADGPKKIQMRFVRSVSKNDLTKAWKAGFENNCEKECERFTPALDNLNAMMTAVKDGQSMSFLFLKDKVEVSLDEKALGKIEGAGIDSQLLRLWIGNPPNSGLKEGLLGSE
ncbi:MAG: chalcone isomerase family protein [Bdellovibrionales bacterium]|nr:chalcone isomerase family protein [Bdellovibrionales bacterium]